MLIKPFPTGVDRETLIEVPDQLYQDRRAITLSGELLFREPQLQWPGKPRARDRLLIAFVDMKQDGSDWPVWLPENLVECHLEPLPYEPHYVPVKTPDGRIIETDYAVCGPGSFMMPAWVATCLDQLTASGLRQARYDRAAEEAKEAEKKREALRSLQRQGRALAAAKNKPLPEDPDQGELF
jgi:hypothetical protein